MKELYLGIDGGGTKTAVCVIDEKLNIISQSQSGPSSYDTVSQEVFVANVKDALSKLEYDGKIVSVFAGLGGICNQDDANVVINSLKSIDCLKDAIIDVDNDVTNAYYSSFGTEDGIVAIIGTGSVVYGIHNGKSHRCGGYCYQEGDAGSSYDLGRKALQYYAKVIDKRLPETVFSKAIGEFINVHNFADLAHYFVNATRTEIANVARIVTKHQEESEALKIINESVDSMVEMFMGVYNELKFDNVDFAIIGSLGNAETMYRKLLFKKLKENVQNVNFVNSKYEAYLGSSIKALINYERK